MFPLAKNESEETKAGPKERARLEPVIILL